jgi:hypothetical protein
VVYSAFNGVQPAFYGEMFPTRVRLSGMAIGTQIGYALGGFAPTVAAAIDGSGWAPVALFTLGASVIAAIAAFTARETCRDPLEQLDDRRGQRFARPPVATESASSVP